MPQENINWIDVLENQTVDITTEPQMARIQDMMAFVGGNFAGAELKIQLSPDDVFNTDLYATPDDAEWFDQAEATYTDKTLNNVDLSECWFRAVLSGAVEGTSVSLKLRPRVEATIPL